MTREMKYSGIEWIGEIPKEWSIAKIKNIKDTTHPYPIGDGDHGSITPSMYKDEGIPYIRVQNLGWGTELKLDNVVYISQEVNNANRKSWLYPGDILIAKTGGTIGKTALIPDSVGIANTTSSVGKVTISAKENNKYYFYVISSEICYKQMWSIANQKSAQPGINIIDIENLSIPHPDKSEQDRISVFLDSKCSQIDSILTSIQDQIDTLEQYKKSVITEAVTKGLNPDVEMKDSGVDCIGIIPKHWDTTRIKFHVEIKGRIGFRGYTEKDLVDEGEGAITLSPSNFNSMTMNYNKCTYISWFKYYESPEIMINNGDILFVKTGSSYGKNCLVHDLPMEATINPQLIVFKNTKTNNEFFAYMLQSVGIRIQSDLAVVGGTIPTMSQNKISNFSFALPPINEQNEIVAHLNSICATINDTIIDKKAQLETLTEYKKSIIYEYVTGKKEVPNEHNIK